VAVRRNRTRTLIAASGAVLVAFSVGGCGSESSDAPVERKTFAFDGKTLRIAAGNAAIDLTPADVKDVEVTRQVDGWVVLGTGPDPSWNMAGDTLTLKVSCKALVSDCESRHRVKVPRGVAVTVDGDNGKVTAAGFDTALKLSTDNGAVTVSDSGGPLDVANDNGKITLEGISARSVVARTDNGAIQVGFDTVPDSVDTRSDNGRIQIDVPASKTSYAVTAASDNGRVDVDVPTDRNSTHVVKARTDNGKVTVRNAN
jgi:hypothetical protein